MKYRMMGATGLLLSEVGFGTAATSGLMTQGRYEDQRDCVARAIELGINYFDTAPDYGEGSSGEIALGRILRELGVRPVITTKVEVRQENLGNIAEHIQRSLDESLDRLGVDYVDVLQIHNGPTVARPQLEGRSYRVLGIEDYFATNGALEGLTRAQRAGKVRFIGFICRGDDIGPVQQLINTGLFQMINVPYTLLNPTAGRPKPDGMMVEPDFGNVLTYAHAHDVGTAIYSPLAAGLLTDQIVNDGAYHPLSRTYGDPQSFMIERAKALRFLSTPDCSLAQAAYRFILMHPGVTSVLSGVSELGQLAEVSATSDADPLTAESMARVEMVWRAPPRRHEE